MELVLERARPPGRSSRPAAARPAHLGHRPLQLPLHLLHAARGVRRRLPVPAARGPADLRGDRPPRAALRRHRRAQDPAHRRRTAAAARPGAAGGAAGPLPRAGRPDADHQRRRCSRPQGRALAAAGLGPRHRQPRLAGRRGLRPAERRGHVPVARVVEGIEAAERPGSRRSRSNMVVRRGINEDSVLPMARDARERGYIRVHRVHGRRATATAGAWRRSCRPRRSWRDRRASCRCSRCEPNYAGEVAER